MITLVLGGVKSGKSTYAEKLVSQSNNVTYIATNVFFDDEMRVKIDKHKERRPSNWKTIEEGYDLTKIFIAADKNVCFLLDCLTVYISNLLLKFKDRNLIINHINDLLLTIKNSDFDIIIVSNEVGMSVINENKLAREFCELAGIANQIVAAAADNVYFCIAGYPQKIK